MLDLGDPVPLEAIAVAHTGVTVVDPFAAIDVSQFTAKRH